MTYTEAMTIREQVQRRIAELDDEALADVLVELDFLEERRARPFSPDFLEVLDTVRSRNQDVDPDALDDLIDEAVQDARRR